jgi:hypothetical protein
MNAFEIAGPRPEIGTLGYVRRRIFVAERGHSELAY